MLDAKRDANGLGDVIGQLLDKGLVINADITISVAGVELLGIKIRAALASFETAAQYGLEFPSGVNMEKPVWQEANKNKEHCPQCNKKVAHVDLLDEGCPWCGWQSSKLKAQQTIGR